MTHFLFPHASFSLQHCRFLQKLFCTNYPQVFLLRHAYKYYYTLQYYFFFSSRTHLPSIV
jgi:hypothetical protein